MHSWEAIIVVVAIVSFARVIRTRLQTDAHYGPHGAPIALPDIDAMRRENDALRRDVAALGERVKVLERIITDNRQSGDLAAEIEALRGR